MSYISQIAYEKPKITVSDILTKRQDNIHKQMYLSAVDKYMSYHGYDKNDYRVIEIPAAYFDEPSYISITKKKYPYTRITDTLAPFWGEYMFNDDISELKVDNELTIDTLELKYIDYVTGVATVHSRYSGRTLKIPLKDLPNNIALSDEMREYERTFMYKVNNKIYGVD